MSAKLYWTATLAGAWLMSACQSSPATHYFALTPLAPPSSPGAPAVLAALAALAAETPMRVERITIPAELDRLELVRRGTANRLQIATFDRWAAPLDEMIRRVVTADLAARLAPGAMASLNEPAVGEARRRLFIDIQEFAADAQGAVKLQASWLLQAPGTRAVRGTEELRIEAGDTSADALAAAMSRALATLSDRIVSQLVPQASSEKSE
jgi:uncharacterized lipoprotein YmbA